MPADPHIQRLVGQKLAEALSDYDWPGAIPSIEAAWRRKPDYGLADLGTLKVSVVPGPVQINQRQSAPRGADFFELTVGIVIAKHVGSEPEIQDLEDLNQAIMDAIRSELLPLADLEAADWLDIAQPVPYDAEVLQERNVFLSQIEVTYMVGMNKLDPPPPPPPPAP
jgi:hypothetical protein